MTTIGYGDFYPRTTPGRILTFFLSIWGVIIVSLMVVALSTFVDPSKRQSKAFFMIKMINLKQLKQIRSAELVVSSVKAFNAYKNRSKGWL
jgi:hypothetical protein